MELVSINVLRYENICVDCLTSCIVQNLWGALMWTAHEGHTEVAKLLLEKGAEMDMQDEVSNLGSMVILC